MAVQPPGGPPPLPPGHPSSEDPKQIAKALTNHLSQFIDTIRNIMKTPHLAESSALDTLATTIEHLKLTAKKAANIKG